MANRFRMNEVNPTGYKAIIALDQVVEQSSLERAHKDLIKIRASQLNGCAFCIDMHTKEARKSGETEQRIYALNAWRDTPFFTEKEQVILALTEEITFIQGQVKDETYAQGVTVLGEAYLAQVILAIITINAWNRIGVATKLMPV